ncbi:hypothetical protein BAUCODRAFT_76509 [Baudoinia panamericana UAMH 10762]|uniref:Cytochrome P450 monooxygenase n=1 Tax=Baudoinia panamericana (strain UAMH 10762) TaxID=717646 RepID=M2N3U9_BAUPA|nr:uncharacterized protein BAUCODRAFT_76509 [Baudoinia panamericana UAMH 10762]EMC93694.1 hypothetical protein BAUCODRAFT_76509 [Baudoinia panamericana UAMH 10762]
MASWSSFYLLLSCCAAIALPVILLKALLNKYRNGLSDIPGPTWAAYTGLWRLHNVSKGQAHLTSIALHRKYGKLVRIAPNVVSVGDANEVARIYTVKGDFTKSAFYPIQCITWHKKPQMNLFSTRDETQHREQKKKIANAYTLESLLKMEPAIDECSKLLLDKMHEYADRKEAFDLGTWLQYYTFDVIGEVTFEKKLGFLELGGDVDGMIAAIEGLLLYASHCGQVPEWHPRLLGNPLLPVLLPQMEQWNEVLNFTLKAINTRTVIAKNGELALEEGRVGNDMLSKWAAVKSFDPDKMSTIDVVVALSTNVFAGSDTTAIALRAILYFLMKNPDKMQKLQAEIDAADKAGLLSNPISDKEARNLPYLLAVEKEAMRLHSSVGLLLERHVPKGGTSICDHFIPEGTIVGINPWVLHYNADVFPDPDAFHPERWLDAEPSKLAVMEKHFFNFGSGSRQCIGRNISLVEMRKLIPQLLREFDVSLQNGEWKVSNVWFTQQKMPLCVLRRRH